MDLNNIKRMLEVSKPKILDPTAPRRELKLSGKDESIVHEAISRLGQSNLDTEKLFEIFNDWQTKRTLTSKRVLLSTSILVSSAAWIGVDYTELTMFGLKVANGTPSRFIIFILLSIIVSGIFYVFSRQIDSAVRKAKIAYINHDLKELIKPMQDIDDVMARNNISSFSKLYYDFKSSVAVSAQHNAINVYRALKFYHKNLKNAGYGLISVALAEQFIIYSIVVFAIVSIFKSFTQ